MVERKTPISLKKGSSSSESLFHPLFNLNHLLKRPISSLNILGRVRVSAYVYGGGIVQPITFLIHSLVKLVIHIIVRKKLRVLV